MSFNYIVTQILLATTALIFLKWKFIPPRRQRVYRIAIAIWLGLALIGTIARAETVHPDKESALEDIDEANLTPGGTWARDLVIEARKNLRLIGDLEDACLFARTYQVAFCHEVRLPSKGKVDLVYNALPVSRRSVDDHRLVVKSGKELREILVDLNKEYRSTGIKMLIDELDEVLENLEHESPLARELRLKAIDDINDQLDRERAAIGE